MSPLGGRVMCLSVRLSVCPVPIVINSKTKSQNVQTWRLSTSAVTGRAILSQKVKAQGHWGRDVKNIFAHNICANMYRFT